MTVMNLEDEHTFYSLSPSEADLIDHVRESKLDYFAPKLMELQFRNKVPESGDLEWPLLVKAHWFKLKPDSIEVATGLEGRGGYHWEEVKIEKSQYTFRGKSYDYMFVTSKV